MRRHVELVWEIEFPRIQSIDLHGSSTAISKACGARDDLQAFGHAIDGSSRRPGNHPPVGDKQDKQAQQIDSVLPGTCFIHKAATNATT